jgi:nucleolar protein 9
MPKENKKRGRREEKKRKRDEGAEEHHAPKRSKSEDPTQAHVQAHQEDFIGLDGAVHGHEQEQCGHEQEQVFFGMLDEPEQEYFKRADDMLELNQFADPEGKIPSFVRSVLGSTDEHARTFLIPGQCLQRGRWQRT